MGYVICRLFFLVWFAELAVLAGKLMVEESKMPFARKQFRVLPATQKRAGRHQARDRMQAVSCLDTTWKIQLHF